jgi:hypothetical protein
LQDLPNEASKVADTDCVVSKPRTALHPKQRSCQDFIDAGGTMKSIPTKARIDPPFFCPHTVQLGVPD